jgi:beta-glucanase (GH16 family)
MLFHLATCLLLIFTYVSAQAESITAASETKPLLCGSSTTNLKPCYFAGNYCTFYENFSVPFRAVDFIGYDGSMSTDFVVESGRPQVIDGNLHLPLIDTNQKGKGGASIVSTTRFLNYGSFEVRLKTIAQSSVVTTFIGISNVLDEIDFVRDSSANFLGMDTAVGRK